MSAKKLLLIKVGSMHGKFATFEEIEWIEFQIKEAIKNGRDVLHAVSIWPIEVSIVEIENVEDVKIQT